MTLIVIFGLIYLLGIGLLLVNRDRDLGKAGQCENDTIPEP